MANEPRLFRATDGIHYLGGSLGPDLNKRNRYVLTAAMMIRKAAVPRPKNPRGK